MAIKLVTARVDLVAASGVNYVSELEYAVNSAISGAIPSGNYTVVDIQRKASSVTKETYILWLEEN